MLDLNLFRKEPDAWLFTGVKPGERRQFASVDNSVSQTWPTDSGFTWTIEPLCLYPTPVLESLRIALNHYEQALKASWPEGAKGEAFTHWNEARKALLSAAPKLEDV